MPASNSGESSSLEELGLQDPKTASLIARLGTILSDVGLYRRLVGCKTSDAQRLLDSFQQVLDIPGIHLSLRERFIVAIQQISARSGLYPTCYELKDVVQDGEHPQSSGGFADIYKGDFQGHVVCLKTIRLQKNTQINYALRQMSNEVLLWGQLRHRNIAIIYGIFHSQDKICIVSPWMTNGDVHKYMSSNPHVARLPLAADVANGLVYLHDNRMIHGDLKGPNILIDDAGRARLADFGMSSVINSNDILGWNSHARGALKGGSLRWQAPELFSLVNGESPVNTMESDVYAWGCVCFEILTGQVPFSHIRNDFAVMMHVTSGGRPPRPDPPNSVPEMTDDIWSLLERCWIQDPRERPTSADIIHTLSTTVEQDTRQSTNNEISAYQFRHKMSHQSDILDVETLDQILRPMVSDEEISAEEQEWIADDITESKLRVKEFFDEVVDAFGGKPFAPIIGDIKLIRRVRSTVEQNDNGRKVRSKDQEAQKKMKQAAEEAIFQEERVTKLVINLAQKLDIFTELATGPDDPKMSKGWRETCELQAEDPFSELRRQSYGVDLLHCIGYVYLAKAKQFFAAKQTPFGVGGFLHVVKGKYHVLSEDVSMRLTAAGLGSVEVDKDKEGLSSEEKAKFEGIHSERTMLLWWKLVKIDIESVLRETCDRALGDPNISRDKAHLRAIALKIRGEAFMGACKDDTTFNKAIF
ncbi:hypothetical protein DXG01_003949 [Tephrocybe rancida]|nr:hypothetical protein DXG01_003949 [Tephrocybe rancida]